MKIAVLSRNPRLCSTRRLVEAGQLRGHEMVVIDTLRASQSGIPEAVVDMAEATWGQSVDGVPIVGGDEKLPELLAAGVTHFVMGLAGAGNNGPRQRVFAAAVAAGFLPLTLVHPRAYVASHVSLGEGVQILAHATVNPGAKLGRNVIINTGAIVEHDCVIGANAHVASGACLAGGVEVGEGAHVGARSVVRQLVKIGAGAIVGAGAAVVEEVPAGTTVAGVPALPLKR